MIISNLLYKLYPGRRRTIKNLIKKIVSRLEGGEFYSITLRKIMKDYHGVDIGMYTHGSCFREYMFDTETTIGRYCSVAADAKVFTVNHPLEYKSTHAFFFNPALKICTNDEVKPSPLTIGHDVWIGDGVKIMPNVSNIGTGAVIGANSVVATNVPPYAIVVGHPARVVRYRFSKETIQTLLDSEWWLKPIEEISVNIDEYTQNYEEYLKN